MHIQRYITLIWSSWLTHKFAEQNQWHKLSIPILRIVTILEKSGAKWAIYNK